MYLLFDPRCPKVELVVGGFPMLTGEELHSAGELQDCSALECTQPDPNHRLEFLTKPYKAVKFGLYYYL